MSLEVIVTTMNANGFEKYYEMNLQTDAVIANQANYCAYEETKINGHTVKLVTTNTRGLAINRNIGINYTNADFIMFADDDMVFVDDYEKKVQQVLAKSKHVDAVRFHCVSLNEKRPLELKNNNLLEKAKLTKIMSGGVWALAIKRNFLLKHNLLFPINYGAGRDVFMGEDSLFLKSLLSKSKAFYTSDVLLAHIKQEDSSWFNGYTDKYFENLGYLHAAIYGKLAYLSLLRRAYKLSKSDEVNFNLTQIYKIANKGLMKYYSNE